MWWACDRDVLFSLCLKVTATIPSFAKGAAGHWDPLPHPAAAAQTKTMGGKQGRSWGGKRVEKRRMKDHGAKRNDEDGSRSTDELSRWSHWVGGWVGKWMGAINHYWLIPLSPAQPDTPLSFDINHDFFIIDPLLAVRGKRALLILISNLHPTVEPLPVALCRYHMVPMRDLRDVMLELCFHTTPQHWVNNIEALTAFSSSFPLEPPGEKAKQWNCGLMNPAGRTECFLNVLDSTHGSVW